MVQGVATVMEIGRLGGLACKEIVFKTLVRTIYRYFVKLLTKVKSMFMHFFRLQYSLKESNLLSLG